MSGIDQQPEALAPLLMHVFPGFAIGGAQVRFAALANHFGRRFRHAIVSLDGNLACRERLDPTLDVHFPTISPRPGALFGNVPASRALLRREHPDVLVTCNWGAIDFAMANRLPRLARHIHIEDGFGPEERATQLWRRVTMRRLALAQSEVVLPSRTLERIALDVWRLDPRHVHYIPNGIDLTRFAGVPPARWPGSGPVIGTVAALRAEKNLGRLLQAFRLLRDRMQAAAAPDLPRLVIAGDGAERAGLTALAGELGIGDAVLFIGHVDDPAPLYAGFDLFALTSDTEQMPLSVIEAMASGLAVVSTDVGDVRAMLAAENAGQVLKPDAAALAAAMQALLDDPEARARIGAANRAKAARDFDAGRMFAAYAALFAAPG